jgi:UPF0176 protein
MSKIVICALYKFVQLDDYRLMREPLKQVMLENGISGSILLAAEGINGTIAGNRSGMDILLDWLRSDLRLADLEVKESFSDETPFRRTKVKLKKEIVTMGVTGIDPNRTVGTYVTPAQWNELISDPEVVLIDTRNMYETKVGTFKNAIIPEIDTFREFPDYIQTHLNPAKHKKVAMFCTGGIRCEKSTAYLKQLGFEDVFHLKGGILKYLEDVPADDSLWQGECFVFDERVTVNQQLEVGNYELCRSCGYPIDEKEKADELYERGVSCLHCFHETSEEQKAGFRERERQYQLELEREKKRMIEKTNKLVQLFVRETSGEFIDRFDKKNDEIINKTAATEEFSTWQAAKRAFDEDEITGQQWTKTCTDGHITEINFHADHTVEEFTLFKREKTVGKWELVDGLLEVEIEAGGALYTFSIIANKENSIHSAVEYENKDLHTYLKIMQLIPRKETK